MKRVLRFLGLAALCGLGLNALAAGNVAKVEGKGEYETLQAALTAAADNDVITLITDATEGDLSYDNGAKPNIAINLNGKTLKLNSFTASYNSISTSTISNGCLDVTGATGKLPNGEGWVHTVFAAQLQSSLKFEAVHFVGTPAANDGNHAIFNTVGYSPNHEILFVGCEFNLGKIGLFAHGHGGFRCVFRKSTLDLTNTEILGGIFKDMQGPEAPAETRLDVRLDNSVMKADGVKYAFFYTDLTLDNGAKVELANVADNGFREGRLELSNGSEFHVNAAVNHGITGAKLVVNDGCTVDIQGAKMLGINITGDSTFAAGSTVSVTDCATTGANYIGLGVVVTGSAKLTVEKGADVKVSNTISSGWMNASNCGYLDIAGGRYGAVAKSASNEGNFIDLTGGIYKEKPADAFVNPAYKAQANTDETTKAQGYLYMVAPPPPVAEIFVNGESKGTYTTVKKAVEDAGALSMTESDPVIVQLSPGVVQDGNLVFSNITCDDMVIQGAEGETPSEIKDCTITVQGGNNGSNAMKNLTIRNILWNNSGMTFSSNSSFENLVCDGNVFRNVDRCDYGLLFNSRCVGFTYVNNKFENLEGENVAAVNASGTQLTGDVLITNNVVKGCTYRAFQITFNGKDGVADRFTFTDNWWIDNASNAQISSSASGSDSVSVVANYNVFNGEAEALQFTVYNNPPGTEVKLDHNYFTVSPETDPGRFYVNDNGTPETIASFGVYPYYNAYDKEALEAGTKTVRESLYNLRILAVAEVISADGTSTNGFETLAGAIEAVEDGQTLRLLKDAVLEGAVTLAKSIVFDGNGRTVSGEKANGSCQGTAPTFIVGDGLSVGVRDLTLVSNCVAFAVNGSANLSLSNVTAYAVNAGVKSGEGYSGTVLLDNSKLFSLSCGATYINVGFNEGAYNPITALPALAPNTDEKMNYDYYTFVYGSKYGIYVDAAHATVEVTNGSEVKGWWAGVLALGDGAEIRLDGSEVASWRGIAVDGANVSLLATDSLIRGICDELGYGTGRAIDVRSATNVRIDLADTTVDAFVSEYGKVEEGIAFSINTMVGKIADDGLKLDNVTFTYTPVAGNEAYQQQLIWFSGSPSLKDQYEDYQRFLADGSNYTCPTTPGHPLVIQPVAAVVDAGGGVKAMYTSFDGAMAAVQAGETVRLIVDVTYDGVLDITKTITLDLGGKTLKVTGAVVNTSSGNLTIRNGTLDETGATGYDWRGNIAYGTLLGVPYSDSAASPRSLTLEDLKVILKDNTNISKARYPLWVGYDSVFTATRCDFVFDNLVSGIQVSQRGKMTITDSTLTFTNLMLADGGVYWVASCQDGKVAGTEINLVDSTVSVDGAEDVFGWIDSLNLNNTSVTLKNIVRYGSSDSTVTFGDGASMSVNSGTYDFDPSDYVMDGYAAYANLIKDGTWTVAPITVAALRLNAKNTLLGAYATGNEAIGAAQSGETVVLVSDTATAEKTLNRGEKLTLVYRNDAAYDYKSLVHAVDPCKVVAAVDEAAGKVVLSAELDGGKCPAAIYDAAGNPTYYATFAEALAAAKSGGTISVNREIEETEPVEIANKSVTLDLAGQLVNAGISFTGTQETDFIIDSIGGGKVLGTITVDPGCTLRIRAGTYAFNPSVYVTETDPETDRALYVVVAQEGGFYKVMPNQIEVKVPDPKEVVATDESGDPIPPSEVAEAAAAIVKANEEIKQTIEQNSSIDTGIENAAKEPVKTPSGEIVPGPAKSGVVKALQAEAPEAAKGQITALSDIGSRVEIDIKQEIATIRTVTTAEGQKKDAIFTTIIYKVEPIVKTVVTVTDEAGNVSEEVVVEATLPNEDLKKTPLTFRLGIKDPAATGAYVRHIGHDEFEDETVFCKVQGPAGGRYVELKADHFSDFEVRTVDAVVVDTDDAVGIVNLGVPGADMELAAAVPFLKSGVSGFETAPNATLADLVVTGRQDGDKIVFQNENAEATLSGDVWSGDAAKTPGTAFWYKSAAGSGDVPLTLAGLVTDPVSTAVEAGTAETPVATLLVNPYVAAQDVFAAVGDAARDGDQVALVGGDVRYVRENGAWGYWKKSEYRAKEEVAQGGLFMSNEFVRVSSLSVPGGRGVWYVSKGGHPTVAWNAGVETGTAEQVADADLPTFGSVAWDVSLTGADMDAFAPEKVSLVAYDAAGARVGDYARPLVVDALGQHWTTFLGLDGYDWTDKDVTAAQFAVELLDAAENVLASTEKVGFGDLLTEKALDVTYAGDVAPAVALGLHTFAGFSVSDNGEFASLTNAFAGFGYVTKTAGGLTVTLTNDMEGVVTIADNLGSVTLDLNGFSITGTNGVNGAGGVALAVTDHIVPGGAATQLLVKDRTGNGGKIVGGKGDRGAAGYAGGAAIVIADGVTVALATGDALPLVKGGDGGTGYVSAGGAAGYAVAKASGEKVSVDGTDDTAQPGEFWEAWAWCVCDTPAAEIPGTYYDGTKLWIHRREGNERTGAAEFDFAELKNLNVVDGAIHFLPGDFGVKCLTVGTDASDSLAFLGADTGTTLYESSHFSVFDVKRGEGQSACWTNITFTSVGIDDLYGLGGGAIRQEGGSLVVSQCVFSNLVANVGGAIYAEFLAKDSLIADSVFADNEAINYGSEGGAVFAAAKAGTDVTLALEKCSFTGNRAGNGGAVSVASDFEGDGPITLAVADSRFEGNAADFAGGAIFGNPKALLVDAAATKDDPGETAFLGNSAELSGGAICLNGDLYVDRPAVTMRRGVRFVGNIASNALDFADGGAFACGLRGGCEFAAEGVEFTGNLAFGKYEAFGGALSFYTNCAVTVDTCVFDDNDAVCPLETLYLNYGGAIESEHGAASIRNSTFRNSNVEAVALICGTAAITNCVAVGNGETVGDYKYDDLYFDACAADVSYSAWGTVFFYEGDSVTGVFNLTNRTTEIYAGDDTLRLNPVGLNPVAALGVKQEAYDFVGVKYGSKAYGSSMGAYETPTERLYVNLNGDKTYDGTTASNDVTWTWTYTTESGAPAAWDDFVTADKFDTVFTLTNWVYGCKDHGYYATTNAAPRDLDAQIKGNDDLAQWYLDSGILEFVGTGAIARRPVEMGGLEFTIDPDEYEWNDGNPVDATVTVVEKIGNLAPLTLVEGTDYHLTCSENTDYTKKAVATADLLHNWIGSTNDTYYITAYLVEYLYDDVVDASLTETYGKTSGVAVAVSDIVNPRTGYAFDLYNSPTNGTVRKFDEGDGILRLKVCYYTDVAPADGIPDIYQRKVLAKVVNGSWNTGYKDDATLYATLWDDAGKWSRTGSGAISSGTIPVGGNNAFGQFSAGGWLALTSGGLVEVSNPATFEFDSSTVPFLIYAYRHGTEAGGSGRGGSGRGGSSGRPGSGTAPAQTSLLEQYSAVLSIRDVSFAVDGVTLQTKAVVSGNGADIDVPMEGTTLKVFATESLGKPWNEVKATADGEGRVTIPGNGAASCFFKVGL